MTRDVVVFRSNRVADLYLFVDAGERLTRVPDALLTRFGAPVEAMTLTLSADRKLARVRAADVLDAIADQGFFLQLPPQSERWRDGG
jgi:uncharacterized protein YcgL (UPF0745 family)